MQNFLHMIATFSPLTFIYFPQHPFLKHTQFLLLGMKYGSL